MHDRSWGASPPRLSAGMLPAGAAGLSADLRKRIEIMAEHIARNGPDFENTVRQKNVSNPQFVFLYSGEGSEYYQHVLAGFRAGGAGPAAQQAAQGSANGSDTTELLRRWKEPPVYPLAPELDRQLMEVIASLEAMASRDAIRNGRAWIECNSALVPMIAGQIMKRIGYLPTASHRLHLLYLIHDVLQTEAARKDAARPIIQAFKPFLLWILRPAYRLAPTADDSARVLRLLQLWVERAIIDDREADEMKALVMAVDLPSGIVQGHAMPKPGMMASPRPPFMAASHPASRPGFPMAPRPSSIHQMARPQGLPPAQMNPYAMQMPSHPAVMFQQPLQGCMSMGQIPSPAMPRPRLQGYLPLANPGMAGKQTPETVPVGVLATMMMHAVRRVGRANFVAYRPLDTALTPQMLPPMEVPQQRLLERVEDFYLDLKDDERGSSSSRSSSSRSASRSASRSRSRSRERDEAAAAAASKMLAGSNFSSAAPPTAVN